MFPIILKNCPELNNNDIFIKLYTEVINITTSSKQLMLSLHKHIESYNNRSNIDTINENSYNNELNKIIMENNKTISKIQSEKNNLLKQLDNDKSIYEIKINSLEKENENLTKKLMNNYNNYNNFNKRKSYTIMNSRKNLLKLDNKDYFKSKTPKNYEEKPSFENIKKSYEFENHKVNSPNKSIQTTLSKENNMIHTVNKNINYNIAFKNSPLSLNALKEFINELYISKDIYNQKCNQLKLPKETLEEYMYTFLTKKYGLKNIVINWAKNIIEGIKKYSKIDSTVLLFGKILRNEQEEDARFILQKISNNIQELLLFYLKRQNPLKTVDEIEQILKNKLKSELFEEEWKGIIFTLYDKKEAEEMQIKIENFVNKENQIRKTQVFQQYKNTRLNKNSKINNNITNINGSITNIKNSNNSKNNNDNSLNITTINSNNISFNINVTSPLNSKFTFNSKLTRFEKYKMIFIQENKKIKYDDFIRIVSRCHIKFRDQQLKNFVQIFNSIDTDKDGIINEEEFSELIHTMKIFKKEEVNSYIYYYLEKIDPFDNQQITFSECISFFAQEMIKDNDKDISILEKICINNLNKNQRFNNNKINSIESNKIRVNEIKKNF